MITLVMPETPLEFADRFLLTAEAYHIPVILLINKIDLLDGKSVSRLRSVAETYRFAGYTCMEISVKTGSGIPAVLSSMKDKTSLLAGNSGVGKSSLINLICPIVASEDHGNICFPQNRKTCHHLRGNDFPAKRGFYY